MPIIVYKTLNLTTVHAQIKRIACEACGGPFSYVVMEKLPFPFLGDPVVRARAAEVRERGGHEFADYVLPLMLDRKSVV